MPKWSQYLDWDYEDKVQKTERIPHKPRREELDKTRETNKLKPPPAKKKQK